MLHGGSIQMADAGDDKLVIEMGGIQGESDSRLGTKYRVQRKGEWLVAATGYTPQEGSFCDY